MRVRSLLSRALPPYHIDAIGTAIDLGGADLDEPTSFGSRLEAMAIECGPVLHEVQGRGKGIKLGSHGSSPSVGSDTKTIQHSPM